MHKIVAMVWLATNLVIRMTHAECSDTVIVLIQLIYLIAWIIAFVSERKK